jgi:uncharacterized protein YlaI
VRRTIPVERECNTFLFREEDKRKSKRRIYYRGELFIFMCRHCTDRVRNEKKGERVKEINFNEKK